MNWSFSCNVGQWAFPLAIIYDKLGALRMVCVHVLIWKVALVWE
ncbi:MAG: hypothetical protein WC657_07875 [Candidatus Paceibacterota bacterium]